MECEVFMGLRRHCNIRPDDAIAASVPLHIGFAAIPGHLPAAIAFRLGHLFARDKARKLRDKDCDDEECYGQDTHDAQYTCLAGIQPDSERITGSLGFGKQGLRCIGKVGRRFCTANFDKPAAIALHCRIGR
jgi:hypothetical protein